MDDETRKKIVDELRLLRDWSKRLSLEIELLAERIRKYGAETHEHPPY